MIRVKDLPEQIGTTGARALLYCPRCQSEYSAHRGDYFMAAPDQPMRCRCTTRRPALRLVTKHVIYKPTTIGQAGV